MKSIKLYTCFVIFFSQIIFSKNFSGYDYKQSQPTFNISKQLAPPVIDGIIQNDPAYQNSQIINHFWQTTPTEGEPSTELTEVRLFYTEEVLYIGVICFDKEPEKIIASEKKRDGALEETDAFLILLDTFNDNQNGFIFGTNPVGLEYDAQVSNEGDISALARRSGSTGGLNVNWDASWNVKTTVTDFGWCAEFAIPFKTLRYLSGENQEWGLNFQRNIRRKKEISYWSKLPRQYNLNRVSLAGTLKGLEIKTPQNFKLIPYTLNNSQQIFTDKTTTKNNLEVGADLKYSITPSLTLDATLNTDFAQVEVDEQQVNLDRFDLFFPEKRPFFLENAGMFDIGSPSEVEMFFSRRIGIGTSGQVIPIIGGGRITGKISSTNIGILNMQTESVGDILKNNFTVLRAYEDLPNRSNVGFIFTNRQSTATGNENNYNRLFAVDGKMGIGLNTNVSGYFSKTVTPNISGDQHAFRLGMMHSSQEWRFENFYTEVAQDFNPEVGFLKRKGYRKFETLIFHSYRPENFLSLHEVRPHFSYRGFWDIKTGFLETGFIHLDNHWEFKSGHEFHTGLNFTTEGVEKEFTIFENGSKTIIVPVGSFKNIEGQFVIMTNQASPLSFSVMSFVGGYFSGNRISLHSTLRYRPSENVTFNVTNSFNKVKLTQGSFSTSLLRGKIQYYFTPHLFIQSLVQYNNVSKEFSTNARFGWLGLGNTGLYIVLNELHDENAIYPGRQNRNLIIKYSYLFDVL
ncbi:MAG: DUF5916 domain-containing protein [Bacteroidetes bacterium]|nr:DUF5916 domain-containing protein [Bacteroidota bacterium]